MAIAPVSSVSFRNNYNQVNFEGKKKETPSHTTSAIKNTLKSIPLATLIAMSPLNAQAENNILADHLIENANPDGENARVIYFDTNGNPNNAEKVVIKFSSLVGSGKDMCIYTESVDLDSVFVKNVTEKFADKSKPDRKSVRYYISGRNKFEKASRDNFNSIPPASSQIKSIEVNENLYKYLKNVFGSQLPEKVTNVVEDGDLNDEMDELRMQYYYGL